MSSETNLLQKPQMATYREKAYNDFVSNDFREAKSTFEALSKQAKGRDVKAYIECRLWQARFEILLGDYIDCRKKLEALREAHFQEFKNNPYFEGLFQFMMANAYFYLGRTDTSKDYAQKAVILFDQLQGSYRYSTVDYILALHTEGKAHWRKRDLTRAFQLFFKAASINLKDANLKITFPLAKTFNLIAAVLMEINEADLAMVFLKLCEELYLDEERGLPHEHLYVGILYSDLAYCYLKQGKGKDPQNQHFHTAYAKAEKILKYLYRDCPHRYLAGLKKIWSYYLRSEDKGFSQIKKVILEEIEIRNAAFDELKHYTNARAFNNLTRACIHYAQIDEGLKVVQQALRESVHTFENQPKGSNPTGLTDEGQHISEAELLKALYNKVELSLMAYRDYEKAEYLSNADKTVRAALDAVPVIVSKLGHIESRMLLIEQTRPINEIAINVLYEINQISDPAVLAQYDLSPYELYEKIQFNKGYLLLGEIEDNELSEVLPLQAARQYPHDLIKLLKDIGQDIDYCLGEHDLLGALSALISRFLEMEESLEEQESSFRSLDEDFTPPEAPLDKLRERIHGDDAAIVEYFVGKKALYAIFIDKKTLSVRKIYTGAKELDYLRDEVSKLKLLNKQMRKYKAFKHSGIDIIKVENPIFDFIDTAYELYYCLIRPITEIEQMSRIYIIPDSLLWHIPFEVLLTDDEQVTSYHELPYLHHQLQISYHFSVPLIYRLHVIGEEKELIRPEKFMFALGSDDESRALSLKKLDEWSQKTEKVYPVAPMNEFNGEDILEVLHSLKVFGAALIWSHGSEEKGIKIGSTRITLKDLQKIDSLDLHLLIVPNCYSGSGPIRDGEGILALPRGFVSRKVRNMIYASGLISMEGTIKVLDEFFELALHPEENSHTISEALHEAKKMVSQQKGSTPLDWSGLLFIGDQTKKIR